MYSDLEVLRLRCIEAVLGAGVVDAGGEKVVVGHLDGVREPVKFSLVEHIRSEEVVGADAADDRCVWQEAHNLDGELVLAETGSSHLARSLLGLLRRVFL